MDEKIIKKLIKLSVKAANNNEVPVAAIIVENNKIIATAYNKRHNSNKTIAHAEVLAIIKANKKKKNWRLNNCSMFITTEPCSMCYSIIKEARIEKVYYMLEKPSNKKQYNKTKFQFLKKEKFEKQINQYEKIVENFWKKHRKK